jgi:hypothetical protein
MKPFRLTPPKPYIPKEYEDQVEVFNWLATCTLDGADMAFSTLNGIRLSIGLARKAKRAGNKQGVPDILIDAPRQGFNGVRIELKREKGGRISQEQQDWHFRLRQEGYMIVVAKGSREAISAIKDYLDPRAT